ncbi:hypothetical protein CYMTET_20370 [Cymbomonas tetramitiformis]|uniref:Uncharacterized protein n=1 Tax=Cymbomonas tetramitiformis TaxID=36881 RepID=A0AAE0G4D0_9CHLO|nr:hypothetical protein CYMTET_20370 [Cymbomonas tetramitiformis]
MMEKMQAFCGFTPTSELDDVQKAFLVSAGTPAHQLAVDEFVRVHVDGAQPLHARDVERTLSGIGEEGLVTRALGVDYLLLGDVRVSIKDDLAGLDAEMIAQLKQRMMAMGYA